MTKSRNSRMTKILGSESESQLANIVRKAMNLQSQSAGKSKQARRRQRQRAMRMQPNPSMDAPISRSTYRQSKGAAGDRITLQGTSRVRTVEIPTGAPNGQLIANVEIQPQSFAGTRLPLFCDLYGKFRFSKLDFHLAPLTPSVATGGYVAGILPDVTTVLASDGDTLISQLLATKGAVEASIWQPTTVCHTDLGKHNALWTSKDAATLASEPLLTSQGKFCVCTQGQVNGGSPGSAPLSLAISVDYTIEFWEPISRVDDNVAVTLQFPVGGPNLYFPTGADQGLKSIEPLNQNYLTETIQFLKLYSDTVYAIDPPFPGSMISTGEPAAYAWITSSGQQAGNLYTTDKVSVAIGDGAVQTGVSPPVYQDASIPIVLHPIKQNYGNTSVDALNARRQLS